MNGYELARKVMPGLMRHILRQGEQKARDLVSHNLSRTRILLGAEPQYGIAAGYVHRNQVVYYDDSGNTDDWQKKVNEYAAALMRTDRLSSVLSLIHI